MEPVAWPTNYSPTHISSLIVSLDLAGYRVQYFGWPGPWFFIHADRNDRRNLPGYKEQVFLKG